MTKSYRRISRRGPPITKVAVSLPADLLASVDRVGKAAGRTRSAVFQDALRTWLGEHERGILIAEYEAGYRRLPEDHAEIKAAEASAVRLLSEEDW